MNLRSRPLAQQLGAIILSTSAFVFVALVIIFSVLSNRAAINQAQTQNQQGAENLRLLADELNRMVGRFQV